MIPIYTSPGRSRFSPKLPLSYDSGGGKGEGGDSFWCSLVAGCPATTNEMTWNARNPNGPQLPV
jgi:hypothetical protein